MKPRVSRLLGDGDHWQEIVGACEKRGIGVTAWAVPQLRPLTTYPEYTNQNVFGDYYLHALCPSQPAVMDYMRALAWEILPPTRYKRWSSSALSSFPFITMDSCKRKERS